MTSRHPKGPDQRLMRLAAAAALHRDAHVLRVSALARALDEQKARHAALEPPVAEGGDPALKAAEFRHRIWAEARQARLGTLIQQGEAALARERAEAARALARYEILEKMIGTRRGQLS